MVYNRITAVWDFVRIPEFQITRKPGKGREIYILNPLIEVSSFYGTMQSRCLPPLTWRNKQIQFQKRCFLVI
jgi:hypothetical protein